jgi:hypothetical protein
MLLGKWHVHMGTSALPTYGILKFFKTWHFKVFKNYDVKYLDRLRHNECTQKSHVKNTL